MGDMICAAASSACGRIGELNSARWNGTRECRNAAIQFQSLVRLSSKDSSGAHQVCRDENGEAHEQARVGDLDHLHPLTHEDAVDALGSEADVV